MKVSVSMDSREGAHLDMDAIYGFIDVGNSEKRIYFQKILRTHRGRDPHCLQINQ